MTDDIKNLIPLVLDQDALTIEQLEGGANNLVYKVTTDTGPVLIKKYFRHKKDQRDRLKAEYDMLSFLWDHGVRNIPQPLAQNTDANIGVYEFIEGDRLQSGDVTREDVMQLAELLNRMWSLKSDPKARTLPSGSDAAFSMGDYIDCLNGRMARIQHTAESEQASEVFNTFFEERLLPTYAALYTFVEDAVKSQGQDFSMKFPKSELTLNPADHGYHNVLRRPDGELVFLDFEYSGWDDPCQMISNAFLQPEVPLPEEWRRAFLDSILESTGQEAALRDRLKIVYPMLAFKWTCIMLNEFLPVAKDRRDFAGVDSERRKAAQMDKAKRRLEMAEQVMVSNPLFDD